MSESFRELHFQEIDSTSSYIKREYLNLNNFTFVSSDYQTNGKGRLDRQWISGRNTNLLFSLLIKDPLLVDKYASLSIASAVVISKALEGLGLNNISIKWPNDVYVNSKKICGVLLEGSVPNYLCVGIGLNVNQNKFEGVFKHPCTSISLETAEKYNILDLKNLIYRKIYEEFVLIGKGNNKFIEYAKKHNYLKGKKVFAEVNHNIQKIEVIDINDDCSLKVKLNEKIINLNSGEISFHI